MSRPFRLPLVAALCLLAATAAAASPSGGLEPAGPPPAELSPEIASALVPDGLRASLDGELALEVWTVRELPEGDGGEPAFGQELDGLPEGGLVGVARLLREWTDYRGTRIDPGLYTLRYLVAPSDGAHLGTSLYRDFLLLVPAEADGGPGESYDFDALVELSRGASGTHHPGVVALFPDWSVDGGEAEAPALGTNELGQPTLLVVVGPVRFGVVVEGHGES